jgi:pimeloyl-ACP methyl ester carboxylesterase
MIAQWMLIIIISFSVPWFIYNYNSNNHQTLWSDRVYSHATSGQFINYKGYPIFVRTSRNSSSESNLPLLLLLHGFPTSSFDWLDVWPMLETKFSIVALDFLGMGFSAKPSDRNYTILEQADIVEHVFNTMNLNGTAVHILSHDYGDTVAQELLWRSDHHTSSCLNVKTLCLLNGGVIYYMHRPILLQKLLLNPVSGPIVSQLTNSYIFKKNFVKVFTESTRPSDETLDDIWSIVIYNNGHRINHRLIHYITDRMNHGERWIQTLIQSKVPIRLINGPADIVSGKHLAEEYSRIIPNADVVLLDDSIAHYPQMEAPDQVVSHYLEFVTKYT